LTNRTSGWLRYAITVIPMTMLIFAALLSRIATQRPAALRLRRSAVRAGSGVVAIALLTVAIPTTLNVMVDPIVGREDHYWGYEAPRYTIAKEVAGYLDEMHLPNGSVLIDTFLGFPIVLDSDNLRQFVLTSDRDFEQTVADPMSFNVRFILVPVGGGLGGLDAVASRWPGLYSSGSGIAKLVREFGIDGSGFRWRLFELGS
jgi:hypothetical protein